MIVSVQQRGFKVDLRQPLPQVPAPIRSKWQAVVEHVSKHKTIYRIGAMTLTMIFSGGLDVFADPVDGISAVGDTRGIDAGASRIYTKLVSVGKWVIIIKGAFDTISSTVQGDFIAARKSGFSYMLVYIILLGLPWAFRQIEGLFEDMV